MCSHPFFAVLCMLILLFNDMVVSPTYWVLQLQQVSKYIRFWEWQDICSLEWLMVWYVFLVTFEVKFKVLLSFGQVLYPWWWQWQGVRSTGWFPLANMPDVDGLPASADMLTTALPCREFASLLGQSPSSIEEVTWGGCCPHRVLDRIDTGIVTKYIFRLRFCFFFCFFCFFLKKGFLIVSNKCLGSVCIRL